MVSLLLLLPLLPPPPLLLLLLAALAAVVAVLAIVLGLGPLGLGLDLLLSLLVGGGSRFFVP